MPKVLLLLAQGCEELEAVTLIDVLRRAAMEVIVAGLQAGVVRASRGVVLQPDCTLEEVLGQTFDLIVLPGGQPGTDNLEHDPRVIRLLQDQHRQGRPVAAICAAPRVLIAAGLVDNRRYTAYPGSTDDLVPHGARLTGAAIEHDELVLTSRGPGTALDFALFLIEELAGEHQRKAVEDGLSRS